MIVTVNWLKEFVDFDADVQDLAHRLTMAGLEVESVEQIGADLDSVVVARLLSVDKHPEADRLTVCQVDTGSEQVQIVCGATNHRTGNLVALAKVGSVLPGDFKIKKSKIRGQVSMGMLCSEKELGLSEESDGIMILPDGLELGQPVFEALGIKDARIEIGLTPNRPDCLSVYGVAREVAALYGADLKRPEVQVSETGPTVDGLTSVTIEEPEHCPRYMARVVKGVKIGPSPSWLVRKLESVGQRSVNNVVDITNLIMLEFGQPMHAFDFDLLRQGRIVVRMAEEGSRFITLDGQERILKASDLVICDGEGPVALAGIMGGENSEIGDNTCNILLESAHFKPTTVRRTAKRLGIHSESSHRFERGTDIHMVPYALDRAAMLVTQLAGGTLAKGVIDTYPEPINPALVELRASRCNEVLGLDLAVDEIRNCLESIGIACDDNGSDSLSCTIPSFRPDLEREIDLVEEVARLVGYDSVPVTMPVSRLIDNEIREHKRFIDRARNCMVGLGFNEIVSYSFVSPQAFDQIDLATDDPRRQTVRLINPLTEEQSVMRTTLVPSMLQTVAGNLAYRSNDLRLFELRPVFLPGDDGQHREPWRLSLAVSGRRSPLGWASEEQDVDFFDLKGGCEQLFAYLGIQGLHWEIDGKEPWLHPGKSARILAGGRQVGTAGELHPGIQSRFDLEQAVYVAEIDVDALLSLDRPGIKFSRLSRFPDTFRDSAVLVDDDICAEQILALVRSASPKFAEDVVLFDIYRGKGVPDGKKSLAFRIRYRATDQTLTDEQITKAHDKIIRRLEKEFGARLR